MKDLGVDFLLFFVYKFYGLKGVGVFYIRKGIKIYLFLYGGV